MSTWRGSTFKSDDLSCCGMHLTLIEHGGGCGGAGDVYGCLVCKKKYMQASGGLAPTKLRLRELDEKMTEKEVKSASGPIPEAIWKKLFKKEE